MDDGDGGDGDVCDEDTGGTGDGVGGDTAAVWI